MKKKIANLIMVLAMFTIMISGVMIVGNVKGWFVKPVKEQLLVKEQIGNASIERKGIVYALNKGTILQGKDAIETMDSSFLSMKMSGIQIAMNENAEIRVLKCSDQDLEMQVVQGELLIKRNSVKKKLKIVLEDTNIEWKQENTICSVQVQNGCLTVSVLSGEINAACNGTEKDVKAGQSFVCLLQKNGTWKMTCSKLNLRMLDDFILNQTLKVQESDKGYFSNTSLQQVIKQREQEQTKANEELLRLSKKVKKIKVKEGKNHKKQKEVSKKKADNKIKESTQKQTKDKVIDKPISKKDQSVPKPKEKKKKTKGNSKKKKTAKSSNQSKTKSGDSKSDDSENDMKESELPEKTEPTKDAKEDKKIYDCSISINCSTILNNMDHLKQGKSGYVPEDGCILSTTKVEFTEGETVYDVLKRTCDTLHIQLEASYTPIYKSYYVEGIHNLYEFDCGSQSGWMYKVNGWYPNYGCSSYKLKDGDVITWSYSCEGLGTDVS